MTRVGVPASVSTWAVIAFDLDIIKSGTRQQPLFEAGLALIQSPELSLGNQGHAAVAGDIDCLRPIDLNLCCHGG